MRYPASEKLEIIRLVEGSHLPVNRTLEKLGVSRPTFYRWCDLYQRFGDLCRDLDSEVWIRGWMIEVNRAREAGRRVVCTDVRTEHEIAAARTIGATIWIVRRPGAGAPGLAGEHFTETRVVGLDDVAFDHRIDNSRDLAFLHAQVDAAIVPPGP